jgi:hypothetical protein
VLEPKSVFWQVKEIHCGFKHSVLKNEAGIIFGAGSNCKKQLGAELGKKVEEF